MKDNLVPDIIFEPTSDLRELQKTNSINPKYEFDHSISEVSFLIEEIFIKRRFDIAGKNEIYFTTVVTDDISDEPTSFKSEIFQGVKKNSKLPIYDKEIYRTSIGGHTHRKNPSLLSFDIIVMESDEGIRKFGQIVDEVRSMDEFKKLRNSILTAGAVAAPTSALIVAASDFAFKIVGRALSMNKDDQVIWITGSFDDLNDDLGTIYNEIVLENQNAIVKLRVDKV